LGCGGQFSDFDWLLPSTWSPNQAKRGRERERERERERKRERKREREKKDRERESERERPGWFKSLRVRIRLISACQRLNAIHDSVLPTYSV